MEDEAAESSAGIMREGGENRGGWRTDRICAVDTFLRDRDVTRSSCRWRKMRPCVEGKENSSSNYGNNGHIKPRYFPKRRETNVRQVTHDPRFAFVRLRLG